MISISVSKAFKKIVDPAILELAATKTLEAYFPEENYEVSLVVDTNEALRKLNREFLETDAPTDVLSFPSGAEVDPETGHIYLGDIIISYEQAKSQAEEANHPVEKELQLLVVHGVLHLLGYDHAEESEKVQMWKLQDQILDNL